MQKKFSFRASVINITRDLIIKMSVLSPSHILIGHREHKEYILNCSAVENTLDRMQHPPYSSSITACRAKRSEKKKKNNLIHFSKINLSQCLKGQDRQVVNIDVMPKAEPQPVCAAANPVRGEEATDMGLNIALSRRL